MHASYEKYREKCKLWDDQLIRYQILQTSKRRIVWQTVRRITYEILGVTGWVNCQVLSTLLGSAV